MLSAEILTSMLIVKLLPPYMEYLAGLISQAHHLKSVVQI